jgi:lipopolysaccharide export system permease protein
LGLRRSVSRQPQRDVEAKADPARTPTIRGRGVRLRLSRLEAYVLTQTLIGVGTAFVILATIIGLIDFVELSRSVGGRSELGFGHALLLTALNAPMLILGLLPFAFLFGVLGAFVTLNRRSELIAMRAAGVSAWRFIFPAAAAAMAIGVLTVALINPITSMMNARFEQERDALTDGFTQKAGAGTWIRQGDAQTQIVIHAQDHDQTFGVLRLKQVSLFISTPNRAQGLQFSRRIEASEARLFPGFWQLTGAREATPGAEALSYDSLSIPSSLDARAALERFASPKAVSFWGLARAITATEQAGFPATGYRLELQEQLARPMLFAAMSILAAAFSLRLVRLGGLAALAGSGVALGFVLFFFNEFCRALGTTGAIPPFAAAWTPPLLALLSGFALLCYTEDG